MNNKNNNKKHNKKNYNILAIFYFFLIFGVIVYLFMTLFNRPNGPSVDTEMMIFNNSIEGSEGRKGGYNFIMDFPKFAVRKNK